MTKKNKIIAKIDKALDLIIEAKQEMAVLQGGEARGTVTPPLSKVELMRQKAKQRRFKENN